ncbi:S1/P1 nuclease [Kriegella aquimaris]|uniref:S1/P1 Nuclease n=1 Tax=Kriegella aquimaris TaxID=192904 RepID=A0A1G9WJC8_9FLAO|nr:S1/P1 nuclease [Kriegella aquimaris]SDM84145.1 S1/P1 Nuclease [Kriegella aquimaris]
MTKSTKNTVNSPQTIKIIVLLFFLSSQLVISNVPFWSKTGHRVIGEIAQDHLNAKTKREILKLLDGESLAAVANFSDEIKADTTYRKFSAWHYVNFPADASYKDVEPSPYGDVVIGIQKCIEIVKNKHSSKSNRAFYLKMLVHLMGDLHQPMHVGRLEDKGGNDIELQWFNRPSNLHKIWDANMIDDYGMSYTELADNLPRLTKKQVAVIQKGTIYDWLEETQDIANEVYESVDEGEKLYYRYSYDWWSTLETQLERGGLRLAKVLNELF